ncbi:MAG: WYL domain-containing protein [Burkholderiaceae bacterium]|nr:WYL domain-containing protein [Burkholderiaceae bacterium]
MNQTERLYRIDQLIHQRTVVAFDELMLELEVSRATVKRDITYMRERLNAPIVHDRERGGYCFAPTALGPQYRLPGLWFNDREALALLTMHRMLEDLDTGGLLGPHIQPLIARLNALLGAASDPADEIIRRVRIITAQARPVTPNCFEAVGSALVSRRRIEIAYFTRSRNARGRRELSPQRLVWYRNAWYLDAWCHRSGALRVFALDAIEQVRLVDRRARDVALAEVDRRLGSGYGIYRGRRLTWATLRFSADAARWVRAEVWHPRQEGRELEDGSWELRLPFGATPELEMDILRHGEHVEVIAPASLRRRVAERLASAQAAYR